MREQFVKEDERTRISENLKRHNVNLYCGAASFRDEHHVAIKPKKNPQRCVSKARSFSLRLDHVQTARRCIHFTIPACMTRTPF